MDKRIAEGHRLIQSAEYGKAALLFSRLCEGQEASAESWLGLGMAYEGLGETEFAERSYLKALSLREGYGEALEGLKRLFANVEAALQRRIAEGERLFGAGDFGAALEVFRRLSVQEPYNLDVWNDMGVVLFSMGMFDEAEAAFIKALGIKGDDENTLQNIKRLAELRSDMVPMQQLLPKDTGKKIPCVVLVYYDFDVIKETIDSLLSFSDRLELHIIENKSPNTEAVIAPYIAGLLKKGAIAAYMLFDENISNNAFEAFLKSGFLDLAAHPYAVLTDGDIVPEQQGWLDEELSVLKAHPEVAACGLTLNKASLPLAEIPDADKCLPRSVERAGYVEGCTGMHMLLMRMDFLREFLAHMDAAGIKFTDKAMHEFAEKTLNMKWASTAHSTGWHLNWDSCANPEHPYTKMKLAKSHEEHWAHSKYSSYTLRTKKGTLKVDQPDSPSSRLKLHLGCGNIYFSGWINMDLEGELPDVRHDLSKNLPVKDDSVDFIYSEHFIEHLDDKEGAVFLAECMRVMKPGGVMRVATPDMDYLVEKFMGDWKSQDWIAGGYGWLKTRAEMLNLCFRGWGHKYLYNAEELERRFKEAGFSRVSLAEFGKSQYPCLNNKETRTDSRLIMEAVK